MEKAKAEKLARELMDANGLNSWAIKFDNSVLRFGVCRSRKMEIGLSKKLVELNDEAAVKDTILHEIAHALVGAGNGHNAKWQAQAIRVGASATRCYADEVITPPKSFKGTCPKCSREITRFRRLRIACSRCCGGSFNEAYLFKWERLN